MQTNLMYIPKLKASGACATVLHSPLALPARPADSYTFAKMQASMLQKKAFAGKQLAAKPVQVRSMDLARDPAGATWMTRLRVLRSCQS
jgi:hypothetical protein